MTQYREILRLYKQGISRHGIAASLSCSRNTVSKVLLAAEPLKIAYPLPDSISDRELESQLFQEDGTRNRHKMPDFDNIHKELG